MVKVNDEVVIQLWPGSGDIARGTCVAVDEAARCGSCDRVTRSRYTIDLNSAFLRATGYPRSRVWISTNNDDDSIFKAPGLSSPCAVGLYQGRLIVDSSTWTGRASPKFR